MTIGEGYAFRTVVKHDEDGRQYIDLERYTCVENGHVYGALLTRGPRQGLPKLGGRCICEAERWTKEKDAALPPEALAQYRASLAARG